MKCPHCIVEIHVDWSRSNIRRDSMYTNWDVIWAVCPNPACGKFIFDLKQPSGDQVRVFPSGSNRAPAPKEVPELIAQDYKEACIVLTFSPKASAALSRRCLQTILHEHGYKGRDLAAEIDMLLNEQDPRKAIPDSLRTTIDGIRNFGNFSAHPITDLTSLQVIDVEPEEAEWCLETVEEMFQHFYVRAINAKERKDALDTKLKAAGKPPSK